MMMSEFQWVSNCETSEETLLEARKIIIAQARAKKAFWLLPEPDENQYYFLDTEKTIKVIYRAPKEISAEIIFSEDDSINCKALNGLKTLKFNHEIRFWSTKNISHPELKQLNHSTMGMFQSTARERHHYQKQKQTLHSVLGHNLNRKPSEYYPTPLNGHLYQLIKTS